MTVRNSANGASTQLHLNMMTVANLPADQLRAAVRSLVAIHPQITSSFEQQVRFLVQQQAKVLLQSQPANPTIHDLKQIQSITRCMLASGNVFESIPLVAKLIFLATQWSSHAAATESRRVSAFLASVDGDVVQAMTAIQKALMVPQGARELTSPEKKVIQDLFDTLMRTTSEQGSSANNTRYDRGLAATAQILGIETNPTRILQQVQSDAESNPAPPIAQETFQLGSTTLPRIFSGLWQMSSPSWGTASTPDIMHQFSRYVQSGFTAFDMADHYGDAELIFGRFRSQYAHTETLFTATKMCVFNRMPTVSREAIAANVSERCRRLQQPRLDMLQFHWQYYQDSSYLDALRLLASDDRVGMIGLCNFDTENMRRVVDAGIPIYTNQVQFSLIDSRPVVEMADFCTQHNIKLLTYGTLCGGFLSDKWLGQPEPDLYGSANAITPSQRKYYSMISNWGGWDLLQALLRTLLTIATKHKVPGISNVATRWVLDHSYVGAVIVGARMGISDHADANKASFGWNLDQEDCEAIETILKQSRRQEMFELIGDCGAEYRT